MASGKRRWRVLFMTVVSLSLLLCLAMIVFWVRSYRGSDFISRRTFDAADSFSITHSDRMLSFSHGEIRWSRGSDTLSMPGMSPPGKPIGAVDWSWGRLGVGHMGWETPPPRTFWNHFGFASWDDGLETSFTSIGRHYFSAPIWLAVLAFLILPGLWVIRRMRGSRRALSGQCAVCGYDLRATPQRCPECGTEAV